MRWILVGLVGLFGMTVYLIAQVGQRDHCTLWHRGDEWSFVVVATVGSNALIAVCYFGIPALIAVYAVRLWRARLPRWLTLLAITFGCFVLWCGLTHVDAMLARPLVYCTESLVVKLLTAFFSLVSLVACAICTEPILLLIAMVSRSKLLAPILSLSSPFETAAVLRRAMEEADRG
jgi:hypothetical protein